MGPIKPNLDQKTEMRILVDLKCVGGKTWQLKLDQITRQGKIPQKIPSAYTRYVYRYTATSLEISTASICTLRIKTSQKMCVTTVYHRWANQAYQEQSRGSVECWRDDKIARRPSFKICSIIPTNGEEFRSDSSNKHYTPFAAVVKFSKKSPKISFIRFAEGED